MTDNIERIIKKESCFRSQMKMLQGAMHYVNDADFESKSTTEKMTLVLAL